MLLFFCVIEYVLGLVTTLYLQQLTQNWRGLPFLETDTMGAAHLACVGSMIFSASSLSISVFSDAQVFGPAWYGAGYTVALSGLRSSVRWDFANLMRSMWRYHLVWNSESMQVNSFL